MTERLRRDRLFDWNRDHLRIGRLLFSVARNPDGPLIDGCSTRLGEMDDDGRLLCADWFGGLVIRQPFAGRAVAVGWRGRGMIEPPSLRRWWRHLRWVMAGRPESPPMTCGGGSNEVADVFAEPDWHPDGQRWIERGEGPTCSSCGQPMVEVDNPIRPEIRHRRGEEARCPAWRAAAGLAPLP